MILTPNNEYCVILDACVLMPMPLCDTLLRSAEEPAFFRVVWSDEILDELRRGLEGPRFKYSESQVNRRIQQMNAAFPEALLTFPPDLVSSVIDMPDPNDRHVVALAIHAHVNTIVTNNLKHFPSEALLPHNLTALSADAFLVHQYHLGPETMLDKLDRQAAGIRRRREDVLQFLQNLAPNFCQLCARSKDIS